MNAQANDFVPNGKSESGLTNEEEMYMHVVNIYIATTHKPPKLVWYQFPYSTLVAASKYARFTLSHSHQDASILGGMATLRLNIPGDAVQEVALAQFLRFIIEKNPPFPRSYNGAPQVPQYDNAPLEHYATLLETALFLDLQVPLNNQHKLKESIVEHFRHAAISKKDVALLWRCCGARDWATMSCVLDLTLDYIREQDDVWWQEEHAAALAAPEVPDLNSTNGINGNVTPSDPVAYLDSSKLGDRNGQPSSQEPELTPWHPYFAKSLGLNDAIKTVWVQKYQPAALVPGFFQIEEQVGEQTKPKGKKKYWKGKKTNEGRFNRSKWEEEQHYAAQF
jgi:hypothetical protein